MQKDEANHLKQDNNLVSKNVDEIGELSQHDDDMLIEEISFSTTYCICLKETNESHTCTKCYPKIRMFCSHIFKDKKLIFCVLFLSKLKMLSKIKLILNPI